jgi:hypothetical protein
MRCQAVYAVVFKKCLQIKPLSLLVVFFFMLNNYFFQQVYDQRSTDPGFS